MTYKILNSLIILCGVLKLSYCLCDLYNETIYLTNNRLPKISCPFNLSIYYILHDNIVIYNKRYLISRCSTANHQDSSIFPRHVPTCDCNLSRFLWQNHRARSIARRSPGFQMIVLLVQPSVTISRLCGIHH